MSANEPKTCFVRVEQAGEIAIPRTLLQSMSVTEGDTLTMLALGDMLVITSRVLYMPELTSKLAAVIDARGLTLDDMLDELPAIRAELFRERYGREAR